MFWWKKQSSQVTARFRLRHWRHILHGSAPRAPGGSRKTRAFSFSRNRQVLAARGRSERAFGGRTIVPAVELVTGATGYSAAGWCAGFGDEGRAVRALAREPERLAALDGVEAVARRPA